MTNVFTEAGRDTMAANMANKETGLPYVISADAGGLMRKWQARTRRAFQAPSEAFFRDLTQELQLNVGHITGSEVEIVDQEELRQGMEQLTSQSDVPVISLDRAYFSDSDPSIIAHIDATRAVDPDFNDLGLQPRPRALPIESQLDAAASATESAEVALVDDVIFTARGALEIAEKLADRGKNVVRIIAGIAIGDGKQELEKSGIEVQHVRAYKAVLDEVCERDFLAGIPMSGRTVYGRGGLWWSAPYFEPFGDAKKWASIPAEQVLEFSTFCLNQTVELWTATNEASGRLLSVAELPRPLRMVARQSESITEALKRTRDLRIN